jgi:chaperone modulatory protein CbpM
MAIQQDRVVARIGGGLIMHTAEFLMQTHLDARAVEAWIAAGWLRPNGNSASREFSDIDLARARLIAELRGDLGLNDEAIPVVLDLIDQVHGLRRLARALMERSRS